MTETPSPDDITNPEQHTERDDGFVGSPLNRVFPCDAAVAKEAITKALTPELRVEEISHTVLRDPVIVLELMRTANALLVRDGRPATTTLTGALVRLGSQLVHDSILKVTERPTIDDPAVSKAFELHRERGRKAGVVCRIIADIRARKFADDCHTVGTLAVVGEMLAAIHLQQQYVQLQCLKNFFSINYRLSQDHHFDVDRMRVLYLKRHGIPEELVFAVDREGGSKSKDRAVMKPICFAAMELIEAYESDRWGKYAPGKTLSAKSTVKRLALSDPQYEKLYERLSDYLSGRSSQPLSPILPPPVPAPAEPEPTDAAPATSPEPSASPPAPIEQEFGPDEDGLLPFVADRTCDEEAEDGEAITAASPEPSLSTDQDGLLDERLDDDEDEEDDDLLDDEPQREPTPSSPSGRIVGPFCNFSTADLIRFKVPREDEAAPHVEPPVSPPVRPKPKSDESIIQGFRCIIDSATSTEEALSQVLNALVRKHDKDTLFSHSALIVVSEDRKSAHVVATHGVSTDNETELSLTDPLSPLARCFAKIQSFGTRASPASPWSAKAFALSPVSTNHATPVALYADCGPKGSISFQARRVFRTIVELLNAKLPQLPGEIPTDETHKKG